MKTNKILILLLCALIVFAGGHILLLGSEYRNPVSESAGVFDLTEGTLDDLTGISWTADGETRTYTRKDGLWKTAGRDAEQASQETVGALAQQLVSLQATRKIENAGDPENYGLAEPAVTVTAEWKDGSIVYRMGESTPFGDGYYLSLSTGGNTVYTIASPLMTTRGTSQADAGKDR